MNKYIYIINTKVGEDWHMSYFIFDDSQYEDVLTQAVKDKAHGCIVRILEVGDEIPVPIDNMGSDIA